MKKFIILLLCFVSWKSQAQEGGVEFNGHTWEAPYLLSVPAGWTTERFPIPINFAPQIPYKGVEDIRFAPGWGKANTEEYWSYAFLWYLEGDVKIDSTIINDNLKTYYSGLVTSGLSGNSVAEQISVTTSFREVRKDHDDLKAYSGTIQMLDYMAKKPIILNCKVHSRSCPGENKTFVFFELSPQPLSHSVWQSLDKLWDDFECKKR